MPGDRIKAQALQRDGETDFLGKTLANGSFFLKGRKGIFN